MQHQEDTLNELNRKVAETYRAYSGLNCRLDFLLGGGTSLGSVSYSGTVGNCQDLCNNAINIERCKGFVFQTAGGSCQLLARVPDQLESSNFVGCVRGSPT